MKILVGNNHLNTIGGSETFTYTVATSLKKLGHEVYYYTCVDGIVGTKLKEANILPVNPQNGFDKILCSHISAVHAWDKYGDVAQICHGTVPSLEQPSRAASKHFAISEEVLIKLKQNGFHPILINNPIDLERFSFVPINKTPQNILCLTQETKSQEIVKQACKIGGWNYRTRNKHTNEVVWDVDKDIRWADVVVTLGRGCYESIASGKNVFIFDSRSYMGPKGDGFLTPALLEKAIKFNCSGRFLNKKYTPQQIVDEIEQYYSQDNANQLYQFAKTNLDSLSIVQQLIDE